MPGFGRLEDVHFENSVTRYWFKVDGLGSRSLVIEIDIFEASQNDQYSKSDCYNQVHLTYIVGD